jgi:hypothetical protein
MRALLDIDEGLLAAAEREATRRGQSLSALVTLALSAFVAPTPRTECGPRGQVNLPTFLGKGLRPGVNLDDSAALLELMESRPHSLLELEGLGAELWHGVDAQEYVDELRREWDHRP